ncbi:hypothetical protein KC19_9G045500 [Ceratodon purpureus]|uniref:Uncharacterized protein n=1 Tax=Ceratodon purpureus TaxID=3225 RepID=A0A8T0GS84_CERPU|nr:hypothetical protein KC19_9G045500 [Ceratodon purpureus]
MPHFVGLVVILFWMKSHSRRGTMHQILSMTPSRERKCMLLCSPQIMQILRIASMSCLILLQVRNL